MTTIYHLGGLKHYRDEQVAGPRRSQSMKQFRPRKKKDNQLHGKIYAVAKMLHAKHKKVTSGAVGPLLGITRGAATYALLQMERHHMLARVALEMRSIVWRPL